MSHAVVFGDGSVKQLDRLTDADEQVTESDVNDTWRVARLFARLLREVRRLSGRWNPRVIDTQEFEVDATGTTVYRIQHNFGGRVNWWVIDFAGGTYGPAFMRHAETTEDTLCVVSNEAGTVRLRIEEAGA